MTEPVVSERDQLAEILRVDYHALTGVGDRCDGFETVHTEVFDQKRWNDVVDTVTRAPSGQHYSWQWWRGRTESQESFGPFEEGDGDILAVHPETETITVTRWVVDESEIDAHNAEAAAFNAAPTSEETR